MNDYDNLVALHVISKELHNPNMRGNDLLRRELGKIGVGTLIIPGGESAYDKTDQGILLARPTYGIDNITDLGRTQEYQIGKGGIEVVRTRVAVPRNLESQINVLNGPKLWEFDDKWKQYELIKDFMPNTVKLESNENIYNAQIDNLIGDKLVVKAASSMGSKHITITERDGVFDSIQNMRSIFVQEQIKSGATRNNSDILIQEYVPGLKWPELVGVNESSKSALVSANDTELRIYCSVDREKNITAQQRYYATARVFYDGLKDDWASIDQDSVPEEAWHIADVVSDRFLSKAGVDGGYFAVDLIKSELPDGKGQRLFVREVNFAKPVMVAEKYNKDDSTMQRRLLANLIKTMAK